MYEDCTFNCSLSLPSLLTYSKHVINHNLIIRKQYSIVLKVVVVCHAKHVEWGRVLALGWAGPRTLLRCFQNAPEISHSCAHISRHFSSLQIMIQRQRRNNGLNCPELAPPAARSPRDQAADATRAIKEP